MKNREKPEIFTLSDELKISAYDKLTPQRKLLVDAVLKNLEKGTGLWEQGWSGGSEPVSAITGKQYNGVNRIFLMLASMEKGYSDNRWLTYKHLKISLKKNMHLKERFRRFGCIFRIVEGMSAL